MNFIRENFGKWIVAAIIITVGILCIIAGAKFTDKSLEQVIITEPEVLNNISYVLGITFIVVGSLSFILAVCIAIFAKKPLAVLALPGATLIGVGASLVVLKYAYYFIELLLKVAPYLLIAVGAVILLDACVTLIRALMAKKAKEALVAFICALVLAAAAIVLGALCIGDEPVIKYGVQLIVFGIIVVLAGFFRVLVTFVKLPDTVVIVSKK